jgi:4-hydroxy-3-polyprenylbenzoate decarboxylase
VYGVRLLEVLRGSDYTSHVIVTPAARLTLSLETDYSPEYVDSLADHLYELDAIGARLASGSFSTMGMVIAPCSVKTASMIANSISENLLVRAADVTLKERRRLVLVVRETPIHLGHVKTFEKLITMGATVFLPVPAFYNRPKTIDDIVNQTVGRVLDSLGVDNDLTKPWDGS